ncbi:H(+)-transporting V1 sector ATPase subunit F [Kappamyces sp. JEL0680]|nr:H(+)-transporting V1 sector ATPase subunit F [Kappamyces sp. JEL0680]
MQQQDQQVEQVAVTIRNLREIGEVMGNELDDQTRYTLLAHRRLLGEVDAHVDATSDRMQDGIKRMKDFIQANSDIKQQLTIIGLVVLLVILLDSVTGLLLAGIGHVDTKQQPNFLVVDAKTPLAKIEEAFEAFTLRKDIAIILVNQHVADMIRPMIDAYSQAFPTVLEIPSKDHPYDPAKDSVLKRISKLFGDQ